MHNRNKRSYMNLEQIFIDFVALLVAYALSYWITASYKELVGLSEYVWVIFIFIPVFMFNMNAQRMYNRTTFNYYDRIVRGVLQSTLYAGLIVSAVVFFSKEIVYSRLLSAAFFVISIILVLAGRFLFFSFMKNRTVMSKRVVIVGVPSVIEKFEYFLTKTHVSIETIGYILMEKEEGLQLSPLLGELHDLDRILKEYVVDEVIFAVPHRYTSELEECIGICERVGITARMVLNLYDLKVSKVHLTGIGTLPMLSFHTVNLNEFEILVKRVLDILGGMIGIILTFLTSIVIIPMIKLDSPGPVFFKQDRVGQNGRIFKMYKFRTMYNDAEKRKKELMQQNKVKGGFMFKIEDDPRITKIGNFLRKTSLDELPQFINVLKGEMSIVGTRPPTIDEVKQYELHHYRRISIKPGLTGLWQVTGRSDINDFNEVVRLDTEYIDKWSVWLDLKIILRTVVVVFRNKGAY